MISLMPVIMSGMFLTQWDTRLPETHAVPAHVGAYESCLLYEAGMRGARTAGSIDQIITQSFGACRASRARVAEDYPSNSAELPKLWKSFEVGVTKRMVGMIVEARSRWSQ